MDSLPPQTQLQKPIIMNDESMPKVAPSNEIEKKTQKGELNIH